MSFRPHTAFITGGGTGIGLGLAEAFHRRGIRVVIGGRRADVLERVCAANPGMKHEVIDVADAADIRRVAGVMAQKYPELDCVVNNAGVQRPHDLSSSLDLEFADMEIDVNFRGLVMMCAAFTPLLKSGATIINVTSGLAFIPIGRLSVYCATKAAARSFTLALRQQLKNGVRVIELIPPAVSTDLHDYMGPQGKAVGMPLDAFTAEAMQGLDDGTDEVVVAQAKMMRSTVGEGFERAFDAMNSR